MFTEKDADRGTELLEAAGHEGEVREGLVPDQLLDVFAGAHALVVRSATKVTPDEPAAGADLVVVGRTGVCLLGHRRHRSCWLVGRRRCGGMGDAPARP